MLKVIIVILLIANLLALGKAFFTMIADQGKSKRTRHWLKIRISLAVMLITVIAFGLWTGELGISAPWHYPRA